MGILATHSVVNSYWTAASDLGSSVGAYCHMMSFYLYIPATSKR